MEQERTEVREGKGMPFFDLWEQSMPDVVGEGLPADDEGADASVYDWGRHARESQKWPEGAWRIWLILAGRGFGKTRTGSEMVNRMASSNKVARIALVGETAADVRDVMVEGPDGILRRSHPKRRPSYEPSKRRLTWPSGTVATTFAGADPEQLRGPQHGFAWVDELAKYAYAGETWDNLMFGLRMGQDPRCLVTTTPRPVPLIRSLLARGGKDVAVTRGTTYDNEANLPRVFLEDIIARYEGTTVGRQELCAELLDETQGAIWTRRRLDDLRVGSAPDLARVVIGVDPSVSENGSGAACGIVVAGIDRRTPAHAYVLADLTLRAGPAEWAAAVARAYRTFGADLVVAEGNQGGSLVRHVLQAVDPSMPINVVQASRSKAARAEPVAVHYEQGLVHHVGGLPGLEDEMVNWLPGKASPNRLDALVWAVARLMQRSGEVLAEMM